ncbi:unnamed protein product [Fraxinus pennsylvanica]|uniref:Uncharacterized protein n=1 Tax=Fraxinus pennsylvanica TaxID=56036 RepID=A0AAD2E3P9_9LAMI|nr:unnamed protein product [Fraxinus pennsylvanica]
MAPLIRSDEVVVMCGSVGCSNSGGFGDVGGGGWICQAPCLDMIWPSIASLPYKLPGTVSRTACHRAKHHFVRGSQILSQARSSKDHSRSSSLAKEAKFEVEKAIHLDPKDVATHILKAQALELQRFKTLAIDSLNVGLSPLAVKSLSDLGRGDALYKRAELRLSMSRRGRVDLVVENLVAGS